jgi:hypothetical protein
MMGHKRTHRARCMPGPLDSVMARTGGFVNSDGEVRRYRAICVTSCTTNGSEMLASAHTPVVQSSAVPPTASEDALLGLSFASVIILERSRIRIEIVAQLIAFAVTVL